MSASPSGRSRARPVADAPAIDGAELAKAWLVELVALAPLERAAGLPGPRFAQDGPDLCAAIVAALAGDAALDELEPGGPLAPLAAGAGALAAAPSPPDVVSALDALRAVAWREIVAALDRPGPSQIGDLAERLASVIATVTTAALDAPQPHGAHRPGDRSGPLAAVLRDAHADPGEPGRAEAAAETPLGEGDPEDDDGASRWARRPVHDVSAPEPREWPASPDRAPPHADRPAFLDVSSPRLVEDAAIGDDDEWAVPVAAGADRGSEDDGNVTALRRPGSGAETLAQIEATLREAASAPDPLGEAAERLRVLARTADLDMPDPAPAGSPPAFADAEALRATRMLPWTAAIERRLARHRADGLPFAVLCLELADLDRLVAADRDRDVLAALEAAEGAIVRQLRPADGLVRERAGRYWLVTPDTDAPDARALAVRIASSIADLPPHRGVPLEVAIGVTACPSDASDAPSLEALAEEGLFAARAAGVRVAGPPRED